MGFSNGQAASNLPRAIYLLLWVLWSSYNPINHCTSNHSIDAVSRVLIVTAIIWKHPRAINLLDDMQLLRVWYAINCTALQ